MKIYNMRNNKEIASINKIQLDFLKKNLLKNGESDEDFYITNKSITILTENAVSEEEKEIVESLKTALINELGKAGMDIYYE
ncbi:MAG: hypothetical protein OEV44_04755 [Spirochaetota bacterium]|nr:hypothetical protein [Spirochaetota bacterium]